jgi:tRNA uridine 5-carbamoylmethylation protein Kti12
MLATGTNFSVVEAKAMQDALYEHNLSRGERIEHRIQSHQIDVLDAPIACAAVILGR